MFSTENTDCGDGLVVTECVHNQAHGDVPIIDNVTLSRFLTGILLAALCSAAAALPSVQLTGGASAVNLAPQMAVDVLPVQGGTDPDALWALPERPSATSGAQQWQVDAGQR